MERAKLLVRCLLHDSHSAFERLSGTEGPLKAERLLFGTNLRIAAVRQHKNTMSAFHALRNSSALPEVKTYKTLLPRSKAVEEAIAPGGLQVRLAAASGRMR